MNKQSYIENSVNEARAKCIGTRSRAAFNAEAVAAKAASEWEFLNSPEQIERSEKLAALVAKGGKVWTKDGETRIYFNAVPVGGIGRTFDFFVNLETCEIHGAVTEEERTAAQAAIV